MQKFQPIDIDLVKDLCSYMYMYIVATSAEPYRKCLKKVAILVQLLYY